MKVKTRKVYYCDYCKKHLLTKYSMICHEKICKRNPNNFHKCFEYCKHLVKETDEEKTEFYCNITERFMYSYKVENKKWFKDGSRDFSKHIRMPLKCKYYEEDEPF